MSSEHFDAIHGGGVNAAVVFYGQQHNRLFWGLWYLCFSMRTVELDYLQRNYYCSII